MAGFYNKFITRFAEKAQPLFGLLKKKKVFNWDTHREEGFNYIKNELKNPLNLRRPDMSKEFILHCAAEQSAIGFVIQKLHDDEMAPIL